MTSELSYLNIVLPGRDNVREPMPPPEMRLVRGSGHIVTVKLSEPQLMALIIDATHTLQRMRACRDATVPAGGSKSHD